MLAPSAKKGCAFLICHVGVGYREGARWSGGTFPHDFPVLTVRAFRGVNLGERKLPITCDGSFHFPSFSSRSPGHSQWALESRSSLWSRRALAFGRPCARYTAFRKASVPISEKQPDPSAICAAAKTLRGPLKLCFGTTHSIVLYVPFVRFGESGGRTRAVTLILMCLVSSP